MLPVSTGSIIVKKEDVWIHYECRSKSISPSKKAEMSANCSNCNKPFEENEEKVLEIQCTTSYNNICRPSSSYGDPLSVSTTTNALLLIWSLPRRREKKRSDVKHGSSVCLMLKLSFFGFWKILQWMTSKTGLNAGLEPVLDPVLSTGLNWSRRKNGLGKFSTP